MINKTRVGIIFGGQSPEHEISIQSAKNVYEALDKSRYEPILIGISKSGKWLALSATEFNKIVSSPLQALQEKKSSLLPYFSEYIRDQKLDVVFPLVHGENGEDGTLQGFLKILSIPFVGAGVLGSAIGMDKDVMKRLLRDASIPIVKFLVFYKKNRENINFIKIKTELGLPFFVKPANGGSSVGVSKVSKMSDFAEAVNNAFEYDRKILIEQGIDAREIECSVLGTRERVASVPGEIIPSHEFYDYDAKYVDEVGARLEIPAKLTTEQVKDIQELAIGACEVLCIDGMARVDFFIDQRTDKLYLNEVNTIPGFTTVSMYPKLWEASGISYEELISRLIMLALERRLISR